MAFIRDLLRGGRPDPGDVVRHTVGNALVLHHPDEISGEAQSLALSVVADAENDVVVLDLGSGMSIGSWESMAGVLPRRRRGIRLVACGQQHETAAMAGQWLSERLNRTVIAPDGDLVRGAAGGLFVHSKPGSGWVRFRPGKPPAWDSKRYPTPSWDTAATERRPSSSTGEIEPLPGGVWIHDVRAPQVTADHRHRLVTDVPCQPETMTVLLGCPGTAPLPLDDVVRFWRDLDPDSRMRARFVRYGDVRMPEGEVFGQALADLLNTNIVCYTGVPIGAPGKVEIRTVRADGVLGWPPFALELGYVPRAHPNSRARRPAVLSHRGPLRGAEEIAPRVYWYAPDAVVEVVEAGLWIRPADEPGNAERIRGAALDPEGGSMVFDDTSPERAARMRELAEDLAARIERDLGQASGLVPASVLVPERRSGGRAQAVLTSGPQPEPNGGEPTAILSWSVPTAMATMVTVIPPPPVPTVVAPEPVAPIALPAVPTTAPEPPATPRPRAAPEPSVVAESPAVPVSSVAVASEVDGGSTLVGPRGVPELPVPAAAPAAPVDVPVEPVMEQPVMGQPVEPAVDASVGPPVEPAVEPAVASSVELPPPPPAAVQIPTESSIDGPDQGVEPARPDGPTSPAGPTPPAPSTPLAPSVPPVGAAPAGEPVPAKASVPTEASGPAKASVPAAEESDPAEKAGPGKASGRLEEPAPATAPPGVRLQPVAEANASALLPRRGLDEERAWLRRSLSRDFDTMASSVSRIMSEHPGMKAAGASTPDDVLVDSVATRLFLTGRGAGIDAGLRTGAKGPHVPLARCAVSGLSRLPSFRGSTVTRITPRAQEWALYRDRRLVTDWSFVTMLTAPCAGQEGDTELLIWSMTARRTALLEPDGEERVDDRVVFLPGTHFKILELAEPAGDRRGTILLREIGANEVDEDGHVDPNRLSLDELAVTSMRRSLDRWGGIDGRKRVGPASAGRFGVLPGLVRSPIAEKG
ncbi:hypothetical protein [Polymorphospora rubra]|uniref:hypothetical protein n=1 Tax=Polymorphospora rubra TaxID=338584 RepID=UPI0033DF2154